MSHVLEAASDVVWFLPHGTGIYGVLATIPQAKSPCNLRSFAKARALRSETAARNIFRFISRNLGHFLGSKDEETLYAAMNKQAEKHTSLETRRRGMRLLPCGRCRPSEERG